MLSGMTRKFFVSSTLPQLRMRPRDGLKRLERESAVSRSTASYLSVLRRRRALPNEQYIMKPRSWVVTSLELGASISVQAVARSLKNSSPVASKSSQSEPA